VVRGEQAIGVVVIAVEHMADQFLIPLERVGGGEAGEGGTDLRPLGLVEARVEEAFGGVRVGHRFDVVLQVVRDDLAWGRGEGEGGGEGGEREV
jgi:hypothetical protein